MPRRPATPEEVATIGKVSTVSPFFSDEEPKTKTKRKYRPANPRAYRAAIEDANLRVADRSNAKVWDNANSTTVLGLYAVMHEKAYGMLPDDLASEWGIVIRHVDRFVSKHFKGEYKKAIVFVRWKMVNEYMRFQKAQENGAHYQRLIWKWLFQDRIAIDFKIAKGLK